MKKFIIIFALVLSTSFLSLKAKSTTMVGAGLGYGLEIKELAIQAGAVFDIDAPVMIAPDFKYFLAPEGITWWELNANAHYYLTDTKGTNFYLLGGLQYATVTVGGFEGPFGISTPSVSASEIGLNIGAGANLDLGSFNLLPELKFTLGGNEQLFIGATAMFPI